MDTRGCTLAQGNWIWSVISLSLSHAGAKYKPTKNNQVASLTVHPGRYFYIYPSSIADTQKSHSVIRPHVRKQVPLATTFFDHSLPSPFIQTSWGHFLCSPVIAWLHPLLSGWGRKSQQIKGFGTVFKRLVHAVPRGEAALVICCIKALSFPCYNDFWHS